MELEFQGDLMPSFGLLRHMHVHISHGHRNYFQKGTVWLTSSYFVQCIYMPFLDVDTWMHVKLQITKEPLIVPNIKMF